MQQQRHEAVTWLIRQLLQEVRREEWQAGAVAGAQDQGVNIWHGGGGGACYGVCVRAGAGGPIDRSKMHIQWADPKGRSIGHPAADAQIMVSTSSMRGGATIVGRLVGVSCHLLLWSQPEERMGVHHDTWGILRAVAVRHPAVRVRVSGEGAR